MNIRFLIASLALGLLAAGGCARPYEIKVHTDFVPSAQFSAFHTFAFSGMTDRGKEIGTSDNSPVRGRVKDDGRRASSPPKGFGKSAWRTVPTCWYICSSA